MKSTQQTDVNNATLGNIVLTSNEPDATNPFLLVRIKNPLDCDAWSEFVETYRPLVLGYCLNRGVRLMDADDIAQEVMRTVAQTISGFDYDARRGRFRSWLFAVTRSRLSNYMRSRDRQPKSSGGTEMWRRLEEEPAPAPDDSWDTEFEQLTLQKALDSIHDEFTESTWKAFWGTAMEHRSAESVAGELGVSQGAVYIARSRVTTRLKAWVRRFLREEAGLAEQL